ncbi:MAG: M20/M25/M40 family metallo-hydrolase [Oscillospiraceae bacterium]|nr:M20/M25/M40 family metallo-hydrolase [Oscillospiraceae bacterium]
MNITEMLKKFSALTGVSGMESDVASFAGEILSKYGKTRTDALGSVICTVREPKAGGIHILLDAHMDEPGMIVSCIEESGFLRVANCGGVDTALLMASPVEIHTAGGIIEGVICSTPPHLQSGGDEKKNPKIEDILIDTGFSGGEASKRIRPGDRVTLQTTPRELLGGLVSSKALDNRAGCVALLHAMECIKDVDCGISVVFSAMEEVGLQGARTAAYGLSPTHAVVVDVSYAHTPDSPREKCGIMGKGPMIGIAPILSRKLTDKLIKSAEAEGIPYQLEAMGGATGTNADAIAVAREGVCTALVSVPIKYMHSPAEIADPADIEHAARLIAALVQEIAKGGGNHA